jgi:DNA-binding NtrC family response regulator
MEGFEREYLLKELERCHWNRARTARELGLDYRTLRYKIERLQLAPPPSEFAEPA